MKRNEKLLLLIHNNRRKKILIKSRNKTSSFVLKAVAVAVEKTGQSVVSIDTDRYIKNQPPTLNS